uniref:Uncharacterized protein n=1 Tax=Cacopsylla melanoneura TaxID=428564 RepID=A0A8D8Q5A4_9HEMI
MTNGNGGQPEISSSSSSSPFHPAGTTLGNPSCQTGPLSLGHSYRVGMNVIPSQSTRLSNVPAFVPYMAIPPVQNNMTSSQVPILSFNATPLNNLGPSMDFSPHHGVPYNVMGSNPNGTNFYLLPTMY